MTVDTELFNPKPTEKRYIYVCQIITQHSQSTWTVDCVPVLVLETVLFYPEKHSIVNNNN